MYCGTRRLYFVFSQSICSFRAFNDLWKHQKHMKVNVSNAFHILFCLKTEYLGFFLLERIRRPCLNPLNTFAMPRNDWKNMKSIKPTKNHEKLVLSMHPLKKWKIMKPFLKNYVFSAWGYPAAIFQAAVYTHTECIRRNLAGLEGIRLNLSVYGWLWGYPAEIMSVSGCRLNSGPKIAFAEYPRGYPASA